MLRNGLWLMKVVMVSRLPLGSQDMFYDNELMVQT